VSDELLTILVPMLTNRPKGRFNVFEVMHHGTHEKQLSNVFAWLLDIQGTHHLGDAFQRIFLEAVNRELSDLGQDPIADDVYSVRQEVNTAARGQGEDIADIVLDGGQTTIVIENYWTSHGHGHSYDGYRDYGARRTARSVVVMLCEIEARTSLVEGWAQAPVVLYATLLDKLHGHVQALTKYSTENVEQFYFIENMHRHFTNRMALSMNREGLVTFIDALCQGGEAERFGWTKQENAARSLGDRLREEAIQRYGESREILGQAKGLLRDYCAATLMKQLNDAIGRELYSTASTPWRGVYQWTVVMGTPEAEKSNQIYLQIGPSAWHAVNNPNQPGWNGELDADLTKAIARHPDYKRLHVATRGGRVIQSEVSIADVLNGLSADDTRLRDEILSLIRSASVIK
jgi:hypothetical protein